MSEYLRDARGSALVEAALVLPVFFLLIFGTIDFALFMWQWNAANKAVQLGARKAIVSDSVAAGAGLTLPESMAYWNGLPLGAGCAPDDVGRSACPVFVVQCNAAAGCRCPDSNCDFVLARASLAPIITAMRAALSTLQAEDLEVKYAMNYLGYVGRPVPVPVDVTVSIVNMKYDLLFLNVLLGPSIPIRASATLPSEDLATY